MASQVEHTMVTAEQLRYSLPSIIRSLQKDRQRLVVSYYGRPVAVIRPVDDDPEAQKWLNGATQSRQEESHDGFRQDGQAAQEQDSEAASAQHS